MRIHRVAALAAVFVSVAVGGAAARTCGLSLMASLDMTILPNGAFAVPVAVNETQHLFLVDTGGLFTKMSADAAAKLGLVEVKADYDVYGGSGKLKLTSANVKSFKVGNNEAKNFHIAVLHEKAEAPARPSDGAPQIDGQLAPDFLSLFDIEIDMAKKKMNLFSQDHCSGKVVYWTQGGYAELPFRFTSGLIAATPHIQLQMTLDGHDISTTLDTGSANSWMRKKSAVQLFGIDENSPGVVKSPDSSESFPVYHKQFVSLTLGGLSVQNPQVDILPGVEEDAFRMAHSEKSRDDPIYGSWLQSDDFILGMNVLSKLHVYIAYKEKKVYITAADAK